jgi:Fe-S-cluster containining protein
MNKSLPYVISQAQVVSRTEPGLKSLLKQSLKEINLITCPIEKVRFVHNRIDSELKDSVKTTTCKKGCHFCCFHTINLSRDEGKLLNQTSKFVDKEKLKLQTQGSCKTIAETACILLKDGKCTNYENRPIICRLTYVSTVPDNCRLENETNPISHLPVERAAIISAAYYMVNNDLITLPESF